MKWYVIQSKANQPQRAETNLCNQGFDFFSPRIPVERIIRRKRVIREGVVFPNYIFIRLDLHQSNWCGLNNTSGVGKIVSFNDSPFSVSEDLICDLHQQFCTQNSPLAMFKTGDKVQVTDGCFKDIETIVKAVTPDERILVLLRTLNSSQNLAFPVTHLARAG